jgi:hypothetical protein
MKNFENGGGSNTYTVSGGPVEDLVWGPGMSTFMAFSGELLLAL